MFMFIWILVNESSKIVRIINELYNLNVSRTPIQRVINEFK